MVKSWWLLLVVFAGLYVPQAVAQNNVLYCEIQPIYRCETALQRQTRLAMEAFQEAVEKKAEFNSKIDTTRERIAHQCRTNKVLRDHPEQIADMPGFLQLLTEKDFYFMSFQYDALGLGRPSQQLLNTMERSTGFGHRLDSGIQERTTWTQFIDSLNREAAHHTDTLDGLLQNFLAVMTVKDSDEYQRYVLSRNLAELNALGCNITPDPDRLLVDLLFTKRPWNLVGSDAKDAQSIDPETRIRGYVQGLSRLYGAEALHRAALAWINAPKADDGAVILPSGEHAGSWAALGWFLQEHDDHAWALNVLLEWNDPFSLIDLKHAAQTYDAMSAAYGPSAFEAAVKQLRAAPKNDAGNLSEPAALGLNNRILKLAIFDLAAKGQARAYVRSLVAFHDALTTSSQVDQAYGKLAGTYGEAAVEKAGADLLGLWAAPTQAIPRNISGVRAKHEYPIRIPDDDYALLVSILDHRFEVPSFDLKTRSNPNYLRWAKFSPGATVVYAHKGWTEKGGLITPPLGSAQPYHGLVEVTRLKSVTADGVTVEFFDKIIGNGGQANPIDKHIPASLYTANETAPPTDTSRVDTTSGQDTLIIGGHTYHCHWEKVTQRQPKTTGAAGYIGRVTTTWTSDEVPGGLVRSSSNLAMLAASRFLKICSSR